MQGEGVIVARLMAIESVMPAVWSVRPVRRALTR
jgi:hypothetical protein